MTLTGHIVGTKGNTGRGIASIVENADYTITINLTDGTSYTTAPIAGFTEIEFDENYDLVVTKTDGTTITVETDLGSYEDLLRGYKNDAETAATNAGNSESAASGYASNAATSETNAQTYANNASGSATAASGSADSASASASSASTQALKSEGFAVGEQNGSAVSSGSAYYHNNSKYFSQLAYASETNASTHATNASNYASTALTKAGEASASASIASTKASEASASALVAEGWAKGEQNGTPVASGTYFEDNAKYYAEQAEAFAEDAEASAQSLVIEDALDEDSTNAVENGVITKELNKKANIDGYYESLGSGTADQLSSNIFEEDSEPYHFRTSGGSIDIGDRETDMLIGGSVVWNQMVSNARYNTTTINGVTYTKNDDGSVSVSGTASAFTSLDFVPNENRTIFPNHVYYMHQPAGASQATYFVRTGGSDLFWNYKTISKIDVQSTVGGLRFAVQNGTTVNVTFYPQLFDLTQLFGSTIADYIYTLEQGQAGAGVAWFRKYFPNMDAEYTYLDTDGVTEITKKLRDYQQGVILSVEGVSAHKTVGFNQWDEEWEVGIYNSNTGEKYANNNAIRTKNKIKVLPNTTYYAKTPSQIYKFYYDADENYISGGGSSSQNATFTTPSNAYYMNFYLASGYGTTYNHDICINLSWDGERNGEYEPYVEHSYPLDDSLTLRGIPKIANGKLYYDGDAYASDGTVTRKYGVVTIDGSTAVASSYNNSGNTAIVVQYTASGIKQPSDGLAMPSWLINSYGLGIETPNRQYANNFDCISVPHNTANRIALTFKDVTTVEAVRQKLTAKPMTLVYELATPTTETATPFTNPQIVDDFGTEEYITTSIVPVGHYTQYMANLKAKLEMSPDSPNGAGDYIVRQTDGENEYVSFASNATIQDIIARLEALEGGGE